MPRFKPTRQTATAANPAQGAGRRRHIKSKSRADNISKEARNSCQLCSVRRPERTPRWWRLRFQDRTPIVDVRALESAALILGQEVAGGCLQFESLAWMEGKKRPALPSQRHWDILNSVKFSPVCRRGFYYVCWLTTLCRMRAPRQKPQVAFLIYSSEL